MAGTFFEKEVRMKGVTTLGYQSARALNDPIRIKILEILSHKQMTTDEIAKILRRSGHKKATTTIRHHLETLKNAGLIEVAKMVEVRGAVRKYYMSTLRAFTYNVPNLEKHSKLIEGVSSRLLKVLRNVHEDGKFIKEVSGKDSCGLCKGDHYKEYVDIQVLKMVVCTTDARREHVVSLHANKQDHK